MYQKLKLMKSKDLNHQQWLSFPMNIIKRIQMKVYTDKNPVHIHLHHPIHFTMSLALWHWWDCQNDAICF